MTKLSDEMNISPKRRITIPEHHIALLLPCEVALDVKAMCFLLRKHGRVRPEDKNGMHAIAGDLLLALVEAEEQAQ